MAGHVFISYSRNDSEYVQRLVIFLTSVGIETWTDDGIEHGDRWAQTIRAKVDSCAAFIPVMTPAAENSTWVEREIARAEEMRKPVLPLLLSGKPFFRLGHLQHDDVTGGRMPGQRFVERLTTVMADARVSRAPLTARVPPDRDRSEPTFSVAAPSARVVDPPGPALPTPATAKTAAEAVARRQPWEPVASVVAPAVVLLVAWQVFGDYNGSVAGWFHYVGTLGASAVACALAFPHMRWMFPTLVAVVASLRLVPFTELWWVGWSWAAGGLLVIMLVRDRVLAQRNRHIAHRSPALAVAATAAVAVTWTFESLVLHYSTLRLWSFLPYAVLLFYLTWEPGPHARRAAAASATIFGALHGVYELMLITGLFAYPVTEKRHFFLELACAVLIFVGGLRAALADRRGGIQGDG